MDDARKPLISHFTASQKEQLMKRYDSAMVIYGLFYKHECSFCKQSFRMIDFDGNFFNGDLRYV